MSLLLLIGIIVFFVWLRRGSGKHTNNSVQQTNQQWVDYIAAYYNQAKTKAEKTLLERMLADLHQQGMPSPSQTFITPAAVVDSRESETHQPKTQSSEAVPNTNGSQQTGERQLQTSAAAAVVPSPVKQSAPLDNITLLLYFGAFLFLASSGLFVALAGAYGTLRVAVILVVMTALYTGGLWLQQNKPKLKSAGYTFIGMGLMLAPLAGLALYSYVMRTQPELAWLLTSLLCLGLYGHALRKIHSTFMEFIFIGTCLSLFESAISVLQLPVYYYGWGLAAMGLLLEGWSLARRKSPAYLAPVSVSGQLFIPVSVFAALYMVPRHGLVQMGVSLALAALYYGLQAWKAAANSPERVGNATAAHVALLLSASSCSYEVQHSLSMVAVVLLVLAAASLCVVMQQRTSALTVAVAHTTIISLVAAVLLAWSKPWLAVVALGCTVVFCLSAWLRQRRSDMYMVAILFLLTLPFLVGLHAVSPVWHATTLMAAVFLVAGLQLLSFFMVRHGPYDVAEWRDAWRATQLMACTTGFVMAIFAGSGVVFGAAVGVALLCYGLTRFDTTQSYWLVSSSVFASLPALFSVSRPGVWLAGLVLGCAWNLVLIFANRLEVARWLGSAMWLLVPVGIARVSSGLQHAEWYALSYLAIMVGMVVARAVAQKRTASLPMVLSELERRLHSDSQAYVVGYGVAAAVAVIASFVADWRFMPAIICTALAMLCTGIARRVERQPSLMMAVPVLLQAALWGMYGSGQRISLYVALSTLIALGGYGYAWLARQANGNHDYEEQLQLAALLTLYVAPATALYFDTTWVMPVGLMVAAATTLHFVWQREQSSREWAGAAVVAALMWLLAYNNMHNVQIYTHILAALCGLYAAWRYRRGERKTGHQYIVAMLCAATIPLGLQVLSGDAGGLYGWWFLGEQIAIMLLGMSIRDRFVTRWGMYVAVGSVLFQLRSLAWLSLTLLAVFLIGLAVYQLQKNDDQQP
jgi:hypothetical protein